MSLYEVFVEILTALIARLCGRMLLQQNNDKPSSSFSDSTNSQCNASQVDPANNSSSTPGQQNDERPSSSYGDSPNISDITNSQVSANQVAFAKNSTFSPSFTSSRLDSRPPEGQNQPDKKRNTNNSNKSSPVPRQQNDERPSSSYGNSPNISNITNSQVSANQVASAEGATFSPSFTCSGPDSRSPEGQNQPDKKHNG